MHTIFQLTQEETRILYKKHFPFAEYEEKLNKCIEMIEEQNKKIKQQNKLIEKLQQEINSVKARLEEKPEKAQTAHPKPEQAEITPAPIIQPQAVSVKETSESDFEVFFDSGKAVIKKYIGKDREVIIPRYIKGHVVSRIRYSAFWSCTFLLSITIPDSVIVIEAFAFDGCSSLTSVTIPDSVTEIGRLAFFNCPHLTIYAPKHSYAAKYAKENKIKLAK